jgi:hypothetical protein
LVIIVMSIEAANNLLEPMFETYAAQHWR